MKVIVGNNNIFEIPKTCADLVTVIVDIQDEGYKVIDHDGYEHQSYIVNGMVMNVYKRQFNRLDYLTAKLYDIIRKLVERMWIHQRR